MGPVLSLRRFVAVEYRRTEAGRSRPLRVDCETSAGQMQECIVKLRDPGVTDGNPWRLCLSRELVGATIARALGLRVPDYGIVVFNEAFVGATARSAEGNRIARNKGENFASVVVNNALEVNPSDRPHRDLQPWADLLAFDALGFNGDRTRGNPNLLLRAQELYLIDHGMLAPTWTAHVDGLNGTTLFDGRHVPLHISYAILRSRDASFDHIGTAWPGTVTEGFVKAAIDQVPSSWADAEERRTLHDFLTARRTIAPGQVMELRRHVR